MNDNQQYDFAVHIDIWKISQQNSFWNTIVENPKNNADQLLMSIFIHHDKYKVGK